MPRLTILLLSLMLGAGSAVLISCGGDDGPDVGIPSTNADQMLDELERARAHFAEGNCAEVEETANALLEQADGSLADQDVDDEVREGIAQGAARLAELAQTSSECQEQTTTTTTDEDETTTTEEPTTTAPATTTEETTTTTTTEEPPPDEADEGDEGDEGGGPPTQVPPGSGGGPGTGGVGDGE